MAISGPQWVKEGTVVALDAVFKTAAEPELCEIVLFSTDVTIDDDTVYADLTVIAASGGEAKDLTKATWDGATTADPIVQRYNGATGMVWNITGALTVYGWAICGKVSGKIYCAENWGVNTVANGNTITVQPLDVKFDIPE